MKFTIISVFFSLLLCSFGRGMPTGANEISGDMPFPIQRGRIYRTVFQGVTYDNHGILTYVPLAGTFAGTSVVLTDSISGISLFIRSEFPAGVPPDFMIRVLPGLLCYNFARSETVGLWSDERVESAKSAIQWLERDCSREEFNFLGGFIKKPTTTLNENRWATDYIYFGSEGQIEIVMFMGTIAPFAIDIRHEYVIAPPGFLRTPSDQNRATVAYVMKAAKHAARSCEAIRYAWIHPNP